MGILRRASKVPKRIVLDEESYIEVTEDITRKQFNKLVDAMPSSLGDEDAEITLAQGVALQQLLFETFVVGWSLDSEPTVEEYLELPQDATLAIDSALMEHFSGTQVGESEAKKPAQSSRTGRKVST